MALTATLVLFLACWLASMLLAAALLAWKSRAGDWRDTFLIGSLIGGAAVVVITETLSALSLFQRGGIVAAWLLALAAGAAWLVRFWSRADGALRLRMRGLLIPVVPHLSPVEVLMLAIIALQIVLLAIVAVAYPPNNFDSMVYHLPRIMQWEQQRSVAFFPTGAVMQVRGTPFNAYAIAQPLIVAGSDRFANLVQWYAMLLSIVGASLAAAVMGADRLRQIGAAVLVVSIPMGIVQATSTQNDYVTAAWLMVFVAAALRFLRGGDGWLWTVATGAALGLAIATKQTALAFAAPMCLVIGAAALMRFGRRAFAAGAAIAAIVLALNAPVTVRTMAVWGSPLGPSSGIANETTGVAVTLSNLLRNIAIHLTMPARAGILHDAALSMSRRLEWLHAGTGIDPADPRFAMTPEENAFAMPFHIHDDLSGNFVHVLLAAIAIAGCLEVLVRRVWRRTPRPPRVSADVLLLGLCLVAGFVLYSYYFKWQLWASRLHLPLFVVGSPVIAMVIFARSRTSLVATVLAVGVAGFAWTMGNELRPLRRQLPWGAEERNNWYFAARRDLQPHYKAIVTTLAGTGCRELGLRISKDPFEYPLWVLLRDRGLDVTIRHIESGVRVPVDPAFQPCAALSAFGEDQSLSRGVRPFRMGDMYLHLWKEHLTPLLTAALEGIEARDRQRVADLRSLQQALEAFISKHRTLPSPADYGEGGGREGFWKGWWDLSAVDGNGNGRPFMDFLIDREVVERIPVDPLNRANSADPLKGEQYVYFVVPPHYDYRGGPCGAPRRWHYLLAITELESVDKRPPVTIRGSGCECLWNDDPNFFQGHFDYILCGVFDPALQEPKKTP